MIMSVLSSEDLPVQDRFDWFCEMTAHNTQPSWVSSPHTDDFRATRAMAETGPVLMSALSCPEMRSVRTPALVHQITTADLRVGPGAALDAGDAVWGGACERVHGDHRPGHQWESVHCTGVEVLLQWAELASVCDPV